MSFEIALYELENRMRALAERDGDVFLPNIRPTEPVDYVFISMEPSLGRWASSPEQARARIEAGFRNFASSLEDFIVHFCVRQYLCNPQERYHITDISKGAMLVKNAGLARTQRYDRWYGLLLDELEIVSKSETKLIVFGSAVSRFLERKSFPRPFAKVIHFSGLAAKARNDGILGREKLFLDFKESVAIEAVLSSACRMLATTNIPEDLKTGTLEGLASKRLSESQKKLIFNYRMAFESIKSTT